MKIIEIYGRDTPYCLYCQKTKDLVREQGYRSLYHDIGSKNFRDELKLRAPDAKTIPQIFIGTEHIGGFEELKALHETGLLATKLGMDI